MWWRAAQDPSYPSDYYEVKLSTTDKSLASFTTTLYSETISENVWDQRIVDLSSYAGQKVYIAFEHYNCTDWYVMKIDDVSMPAPLATTGDVFISEISDNKSGQLESTGYIELYNYCNFPIDMGNLYIRQETNPTGNAFIDGGSTSYQFSSEIIPAQGFLVLTHGADQATFETAWGTLPAGTVFVQGNSSLAITSGKAYDLYDASSKGYRAEELDFSEEVPSGQRQTQNGDNTWNSPETSDNGTPGEFGTDTPLATVLSYFNAEYTNSLMTIQWATQSETNNAGWYVFRASEADFESSQKVNTDGMIQGSGTSSELTEYSSCIPPKFFYIINVSLCYSVIQHIILSR